MNECICLSLGEVRGRSVFVLVYTTHKLFGHCGCNHFGKYLIHVEQMQLLQWPLQSSQFLYMASVSISINIVLKVFPAVIITTAPLKTTINCCHCPCHPGHPGHSGHFGYPGCQCPTFFPPAYTLFLTRCIDANCTIKNLHKIHWQCCEQDSFCYPISSSFRSFDGYSIPCDWFTFQRFSLMLRHSVAPRQTAPEASSEFESKNWK